MSAEGSFSYFSLPYVPGMEPNGVPAPETVATDQSDPILVPTHTHTHAHTQKNNMMAKQRPKVIRPTRRSPRVSRRPEVERVLTIPDSFFFFCFFFPFTFSIGGVLFFFIFLYFFILI
jgi:hypothetical protein